MIPFLILSALIFALVTGAGFTTRFGNLGSASRYILRGTALLLPIALLAGASLLNNATSLDEATLHRPIEVSTDDYVGSATCQSCHPHQHATWYSSFHRTMTQVASEETIIGDFKDVELEHFGSRYFLSQDQDGFWVDVKTQRSTFALSQNEHLRLPVSLLTGSHHMQAVWCESSNSRLLAMLPFIWLREEARWIPRAAAFLSPPGPPTSEFGRWNEKCLRCHTTHPQRRLFDDFRGQHADTRVAEFGIACESCHGPGGQHVAHYQNPVRRYRDRLSTNDVDFITNPAQLSAHQSSQVCGQCHGILDFHHPQDYQREIQEGLEFRPGDDLAQTNVIVQPTQMDHAQLTPEEHQSLQQMFWSDGMVRVSGREFNGMVDTACFQDGEMSCLSCHQMHQSPDDSRPAEEWANDQLKHDIMGNDTCIQCHDHFSDQEVLAQHTHHSADSTGSSCYNCHMSYTTYGLLKAIRSHTIDSPSVSTSLKTGRPNACNQCHLDQSLAWTAAHLERWYDIKAPKLSGEETDIAASILWTLKGDAGQRALMAWSLGWPEALQASGSDWVAPYLGHLLEDPYDAVRFIAAQSLRKHEHYQDLVYDFLGPLEQRRHTKQHVLNVWENLNNKPKDGRPTLLLERDGTLNQKQFDSLAKERQDHPVNLAE